ncbi:hypothetical protein [Streptomyces sp. NPDC001536]|uniref:hypothetical protein n=1 Tax=Streptomyces sp. NPDC001536 TaxID=3364583 RepID=UPI0036CB77FB
MNDAAEIDPAAGIRVKVTDLKSSADALFFEEEDGQPVLLIRRKQSFGSAVESVRDAMEIPEDRARDIVRVHHPEAAEWGEQDPAALIAVPTELPARKSSADQDGRPARHLRLLPRWTVTAIAAVAALGAGYSMAGQQQAATHSTPGATDGIELADAQPYASAAFKAFATDGEMACTPTGPLEAKCVDIDGKVMYSEASVGSDWTQFNFTYDEGDNRIGLRVFSNEAAAQLWVQEDGSRESVHNLVRHGRYALWGSDKARLREYLALLQDQDEPNSALAPQATGRHAGQAEHVTTAAVKQAQLKPHKAKHAKTKKKTTAQPNAATPTAITTGNPTIGYASPTTAQVSPMPRRLAVLALGTLGIDPANPPTLEKATTPQDMGALVAVSIVMGVDPADTGVPVGELPILPQPNTAETVLAERTTNFSDDRQTAAFPTEAAPKSTGTVETASPSVTLPTTSTDQTQKPTGEEASTTPETPQPETPTVTVPEDSIETATPTTEPTPSSEVPAEETPGSTPEVVDTEPAPPAEEPVLEDPSADTDDQAVDEDQAVDVQDDAVETPAEDETTPAPVEEPDTGAELVAIPDAWRADQAA